MNDIQTCTCGSCKVAWDEGEDRTCQRGTYACSVDHHCDSDCETW